MGVGPIAAAAQNGNALKQAGWGSAGGCKVFGARLKGLHQQSSNKESNAMWTKPEYTEMRFGFEVTMYIANR